MSRSTFYDPFGLVVVGVAFLAKAAMGAGSLALEEARRQVNRLADGLLYGDNAWGIMLEDLGDRLKPIFETERAMAARHAAARVLGWFQDPLARIYDASTTKRRRSPMPRGGHYPTI